MKNDFLHDSLVMATQEASVHIHEIEKANRWKEVCVAHGHHALKISHSLSALLTNEVGQLCRST